MISKLANGFLLRKVQDELNLKFDGCLAHPCWMVVLVFDYGIWNYINCKLVRHKARQLRFPPKRTFRALVNR